MRTNSDKGAPRSVEDWYGALRESGETRAQAENLMSRRHWLHAAARFDKRTGDMLPRPLTRVCDSLIAVPDVFMTVIVRFELREASHDDRILDYPSSIDGKNMAGPIEYKGEIVKQLHFHE